MIEQWFLDLDGVRSGPYQTPEVMSLVAEGEVLPHHRISTSLREQPWITILEWRLEKAKTLGQSPKTQATPTPISPQSFEEPKYEVKKPGFQPEMQYGHLPTPEPEDTYQPVDFKSNTPPASKLTPPKDLNFVNTPEAPGTPKRDPTAEMFDMLQKSKQKREAKQNLNAGVGVSIDSDIPPPSKPFNIGRTLGIGAGITLVGFALGQLFQQSAPLPKEVPNTAQSKPSATPAEPFVKDTGAGGTEVIDRSTDKMTIRARVDKRTAEAPANTATPGTVTFKNITIKGPAHAPGATGANGARGTPESNQNEKELEELRNLKKELQELKNLKNNNNVEDVPETMDTDESGMPINDTPMNDVSPSGSPGTATN